MVRNYGCDLLEISYLCGRINNRCFLMLRSISVVICSKFPTFVVESTTVLLGSCATSSCDLLEISYLCGRINNQAQTNNEDLKVVICSKFPTFVVESTTRLEKPRFTTCCDLLEISYLCGRINNHLI